MLLLMRSSFYVSAFFLFLLFVPSVFCAEIINGSEAARGKPLYDRQQVNTSESVCSNNLRTMLLQQQITFSDSQNSMEIRRFAEESIDVARAVFEEKQSYCAASLALIQFLEIDALEKAHTPKTGQIQSFDHRP
ncbi:hypothetical protein [Enterovibrio calviensis]|uniref:hypothetical protein n=1 Tax=Enterovibrio calviensis TaxID=91359 RepID=UPI003734CB1B